MSLSKNDLLRSLPSVDSVLGEPPLRDMIEAIGREYVADIVREVIDTLRKDTLEKTHPSDSPSSLREQVVAAVLAAAELVRTPAFRRVINASGIILHTGLGRAVLASAALEQIQREMAGYSLLQLDAESGKRSRRDEAIETLLQQLTGCEAATIVNNNAAATAIVLNTVAQGKEVIVSRGQLVEIGGAFRLPEVMAFSGAKLVEVGSTNKTHVRDYVNAITEDTAAILRVHPSNYQIVGFSSEVSLPEMVQVAHDHDLVLIDDVGAGSLVDLAPFGLAPEPTLPESVEAGADIITSSADKLVGASQGGIILGRASLVQAIRKNQFARIVRVDKLTLAVLEATLKLFLDRNKALSEVPTLRMIVRSEKDLHTQAERIAQSLAGLKDVKVRCEAGYSQTGSGSLPGQNLPTTCITLEPRQMSVESLADRLRSASPPIFTRIQKGRVFIDPRTLQESDESLLIDALLTTLS